MNQDADNRNSVLKQDQSFWADISPHWGVWRNPNSSLLHEKSCFSVRYQANAHGMRDPERAFESSAARYVFLGDSMIEGFGVESRERLSNRLEQSTGLEVLNFGTSGHFGPTQYFLLYKHLVKKFSHDAVLIGFLPNNDFRDDDIEFGRRVYADRYRPYWTGVSPDYRLTYFKDEGSEQVPTGRPKAGLHHFLRAHSYSYNALRYAWRTVVMSESTLESAFFEFTDEQIRKAQHSFKLIKEEAGDRPVVLVLLPAVKDLIRQSMSDSPSPLAVEMERFAKENDIFFLDLLLPKAALREDYFSYVHECDAHWNAFGNEVAHDLLAEFLKENAILATEGSLQSR